jgi:HEAT repeat protein
MLCFTNFTSAALAFAFFVVLGQRICLALPASHQREAPEADVRALIDELSTDRRTTAKARLLEIGSRAAPYLIARLRDLTEIVEESHVTAPVEGYDPESDPAYVEAARRRQTAWDVIGDCLDLLGWMKSEEAVPAIIKVLEITPLSGREPKRLRPIRALEEIGTPAVPALIEALARAPETARNQKSPYYPGERTLQIRMAFALAQIGDSQAIPALENLIKIEPTFSRGFCADAIAKMRLRQQQ